MNEFFHDLQIDITRKIRCIEASEKDVLKRAFSISLILAEANSRLKSFIVDYTFCDEQEEIRFFKEMKARLVADLIYHCQLYNIEMNRPAGARDIQRAYLYRELKNLRNYIERRSDFYSYYRLGLTHNDSDYYTRDKLILGRIYLDPGMSEREPRYSTNCDYKLAKILANERLEAQIQSQLDLLDGPPREGKRLTWRLKKAFLVELLYALDSLKAFGKIPLREVTDVAEKTLGISLGNVSSAFSVMRDRDDVTPFLDALKEALLNRMERDVYKKKKK